MIIFKRYIKNKILKDTFKILFFLLLPIFFVLSYTSLLAEGDNNVLQYLTQIGTPKDLIKYKKHSDGTVIDVKDKKLSSFDKKLTSSDSVKREDKIVSINEINDQFVVKIELINYDQEVNLIVYNMLGKQVLDIFHGYPHKDPDYPYSFRSSILPNGIYFVVFQGRNFRKARKFIVAR